MTTSLSSISKEVAQTAVKNGETVIDATIGAVKTAYDAKITKAKAEDTASTTSTTSGAINYATDPRFTNNSNSQVSAVDVTETRQTETERYSAGIVAPTIVENDTKKKDLNTMSREERIAERNKRGSKKN